MLTINALPIGFWALLFLLATASGMVLTYLVRNLAIVKNWVVKPAQHHIHTKPIPRLGGIAIYAGFVLLVMVASLTGQNPEWAAQVRVLGPATILFVLGIVDDFRAVPASLKFGCEVLVGVMLFLLRVRLFEPSSVALLIWNADLSYAIALFATVGWVVLITNAVNLTDGLDGLAAGSCLFSTLTLFGLALVHGDSGVVFATLILGGTLLGFLRYNFNPASIFLGDSGSLFLGCMLSGLALQGTQAAAPTLVAVVIPIVTFGLPIVETFISVLRRFLAGRPLFAPDQDHFHHRLLRMGLTQRQAVVALYAVCAACALLTMFLLSPLRPAVGLVLIVVGAVFCVGIQRLGYAEFREISRLARRAIEQTSIVPNNINIRNYADQIRNCASAEELRDSLDALIQLVDFSSYRLQLLGCEFLAGNAPAEDVSRGIRFMRVAWEISIDLESDGSQMGRLVLRRAKQDRNLMIDLNLLLTDLGPAVSATCMRLQGNEAFSLRANAGFNATSTHSSYTQ
jgi:UDP-GlcNAc:undecaprenyl-phosphate GlcNAc-1-phosphate transferase